jgi:hypothetical protein
LFHPFSRRVERVAPGVARKFFYGFPRREERLVLHAARRFLYYYGPDRRHEKRFEGAWIAGAKTCRKAARNIRAAAGGTPAGPVPAGGAGGPERRKTA